MEISESHFCSFIIKIWLEETPPPQGCALWRGHITHVPSGKRHYFQTLEGILAFVSPYVQRMGGEVAMQWWINDERRVS